MQTTCSPRAPTVVPTIALRGQDKVNSASLIWIVVFFAIVTVVFATVTVASTIKHHKKRQCDSEYEQVALHSPLVQAPRYSNG